MLRFWNPKKYSGRIVSKHNDVITRVAKIVDFKQKYNNLNLFVTASMDGAVKCYHGQPKMDVDDF